MKSFGGRCFKRENRKVIVKCAELSAEAYPPTKADIYDEESDTQIIVRLWQDYLFIVARGTAGWKDVKQDLKRLQVDTGHGDVHAGLVQCSSAVLEHVLDWVLRHPDKKLVFSGHSLGGGLAQVLAVACGRRCACVVFGSMRAGDEKFCQSLVNVTHGDLLFVVHKRDLVPSLPRIGYPQLDDYLFKVSNWKWWPLWSRTWSHTIANYVELTKKNFDW